MNCNITLIYSRYSNETFDKLIQVYPSNPKNQYYTYTVNVKSLKNKNDNKCLLYISSTSTRQNAKLMLPKQTSFKYILAEVTQKLTFGLIPSKSGKESYIISYNINSDYLVEVKNLNSKANETFYMHRSNVTVLD